MIVDLEKHCEPVAAAINQFALVRQQAMGNEAEERVKIEKAYRELAAAVETSKQASLEGLTGLVAAKIKRLQVGTHGSD